jgi:hypothetical protein
MLRSLLAALLCAVLFPARATPQPLDATDMWFDPAESGWGLNLIHQGNTLFATLFVYGVDRQPKWFVASDVSAGPSIYTGTLRECTGAWFGGPYSARPFACRDVGTLRFSLGATSGAVDYTIDGVSVTKSVQRLTFRRTTLSGVYEGYIQPAANAGAAARADLTFHVVTDDGSTFYMWTASDSQLACDWHGTTSQDGAFEHVSGTYQCPGRTGTWSMSVDPTTEGFFGKFNDSGVPGAIAAARSTGSTNLYGSGWRNDMWYLPSENGWGFNAIEQGDTVFGTLFVYDPQGRPKWYFASALAQQGAVADGTSSYTGALYESTGAYFGGPFGAAAFTPRQVGTMSFRARPDGTGDLAYSVDGVAVSTPLQRFGFRKQDFSGSYLGSYAHDRQAQITIDDSGSEFRMLLQDEYGGLGACNFAAPFSQAGSLREMNGTFACGSRTGTFSMRNATVSAQGFTASFDSPMFDFRAIDNGHIAGVRR